VLERYSETPVIIELKTEAAAGPVKVELSRLGAGGRVVVASFLGRAVAGFKAPPFRAGACRRDIALLALTAFLGLPPRSRGVSLYAVPVRYKDWIPVPTRRFVASAHRLGCPVHVWTVDDPDLAVELWDRGCSGMITNYPAPIIEARRRRESPT